MPGGMPKNEYCAQAVEEELSGHSSCTYVCHVTYVLTLN